VNRIDSFFVGFMSAIAIVVVLVHIYGC